MRTPENDLRIWENHAANSRSYRPGDPLGIIITRDGSSVSVRISQLTDAEYAFELHALVSSEPMTVGDLKEMKANGFEAYRAARVTLAAPEEPEGEPEDDGTPDSPTFRDAREALDAYKNSAGCYDGDDTAIEGLIPCLRELATRYNLDCVPALLDKRQLATVLAALRFFQREHPSSRLPEWRIAVDDESVNALNQEEIDELCVLLNCG